MKICKNRKIHLKKFSFNSSKPIGKKEEGPDTPHRGQWDKSIESLLICLSLSVGLGNIWRFPNIAYDNGGGAFLIPYLILLCIIGRPLYYMELILGQFVSQGPIKIWRICPAFKGVGYAQIISLSYMLIFYNYLMALSIYFIFASMHSCLPWTECHYPNGTFSAFENGTSAQGYSPAEHFWKNEVLQEKESDGISMSWELALCLLLTWILVYTSVIQGTSSLGKMAYVTAFFPFVGLTALLIMTCLEQGALDGIRYFFEPEMEKLKDINVWYKAVEQSFFSLSVAYGNIVMIASYNKFDHNVYRDAVVISVLDTLVSILAGCISFGVLGTLSHRYSKDIHEVVKHEGLGLAFVTYPEALATIKFVPQLWSIIFFLMLFILGIGSSMSMIETVLTVLKDRFPNLRKKKWLLAMCVCGLFFGLGLPLTTNIGQLILLLLNNYGVGVAAFLYAIIEVIGVTWIYGLNNFCEDVAFMTKKPPGFLWKITWKYTAPIALVVIFVFGTSAVTSGSEQKAAPQWTSIVGWILAATAILQIPLWLLLIIYKDPSPTIWKKIQNSFKPSEKWGPSDPAIFADWMAMKKAKQSSNTPANPESTETFDTPTNPESTETSNASANPQSTENSTTPAASKSNETS